MGNRAVALEPSNPHLFVATAIAYWDSGNRAAAQKAYLGANNLDPRYRNRIFLSNLQQAGFSTTQI